MLAAVGKVVVVVASGGASCDDGSSHLALAILS
jgi:hypothetical protein